MQAAYDKAWTIRWEVIKAQRKRQEMLRNLEGDWTCRWSSGQQQDLFVDQNGSFTVFGASYTISDEEELSFYWQDGTRQHAVVGDVLPNPVVWTAMSISSPNLARIEWHRGHKNNNNNEGQFIFCLCH